MMVAKLLLGDSWPSYCRDIKELRRFKGKDNAELPVRKRNGTQFCVTFQLRVTLTLGDKIMNLYKSRGLHGQEMFCQSQWLSCLFLHVCEFDAWLDFFFLIMKQEMENKNTFIRLWWLSGLPTWLSGKESAWRHKRRGFDHWVRKIPCSRKW